MKQNSKKLINKNYILSWFGIFIILGFCEVFFFRNIITNDFLIGNRGDGRLTTLITEHWFNYFRGEEKFGELAMFHPIQNVLSYSDMFFFYGIVHSCFRFIGLDMFDAYKYTLILIHLVGTVTMFFLLDKKLNLRIMWALFGTIAFSFSSTYAEHTGHTQLIACSMLPILTILIICFFENLKNRKKKNLYAFLIITWYVLILYNTWYVAFYTALFILCFLIIYVISLVIQKKNFIKEFFNLIKNIGFELLLYIGYTIMVLIPFIKLYLPALKRSGGYKYFDVGMYMPEIIDIINVGKNNWLLGKFIRIMKLSDRVLYESEMGFSIILFFTFIAFFIFLIKKKITTMSEYIILSFSITIVISILISVKFSSNNVSFWYFVYKFIPGASSIRAMSRYLLYLTFPMAIVTSTIGNILFKNKGFFQITTKKKYFLVCLLILLWISNIRNEGVDARWRKGNEISFLSKIDKPFKNCKIFYITDSIKSETSKLEYIYQNDAFEIANYYKLKTINGNSSVFPPDWFGIYAPLSPEYGITLYNWIDKYDLKDVCSYDIAVNEWRPINSLLGFQFYTNGAKWEEVTKSVRVPFNGIIYGPYINLPAGKYRVEFINEFSESSLGEFRATKENGKVQIAQILSNENKVIIEFELQEEAYKVEFTVLNKANPDFYVKDIQIYKE